MQVLEQISRLIGRLDETDRHPGARPRALRCGARACKEKKLLLFGSFRVRMFGLMFAVLQKLQFLFGSVLPGPTGMLYTSFWRSAQRLHVCMYVYLCMYVRMHARMYGWVDR